MKHKPWKGCALQVFSSSINDNSICINSSSRSGSTRVELEAEIVEEKVLVTQ